MQVKVTDDVLWNCACEKIEIKTKSKLTPFDRFICVPKKTKENLLNVF